MIRSFAPTILIGIVWVFQPFGMIGNMICFIGSIVSLWGGIYFYHQRIQKQALIEEADQIKWILSQQRHDWMNHIQVLMGYQTLGKSDKITPYLMKLVETSMQERNISEIGYAPLAVYLMTLPHRFQNGNIQVVVSSGFQLPNQQDEQRLLRILEVLFSWLEKQGEDQANWSLIETKFEIDEQHLNLWITMKSVDHELLSWTFPPHEWEKLRNDMNKWNGDLQISNQDHGLQIQLQLR
ncbi:Spo0B domain-containing protein [Hazenella coriacea]|uniref:Sensor kinase SpoOB-type protein n=1 Tax=Hazenella coriacea TaxID=1179467 RepID=A0A4R3L9V1_9BACL|nr:Spo0B domain-containing protein [Hazenella coriacea]TCS96489.1 sensor kinase SpoOB-type protein [Hazenella coriacea]